MRYKCPTPAPPLFNYTPDPTPYYRPHILSYTCIITNKVIIIIIIIIIIVIVLTTLLGF